MATGKLTPKPTLRPTLTQGNSAKLFTGYDASYQEALRLIGSARSTIQFETFTFNGAKGQGITNALIAAQQRGVKVQVVLDTKAMYIGDQKKLAQQLLDAGVDVRVFKERDLNKGLIAIDHAKDLTIDGQVSLVGSSNFDRRNNYNVDFEVQGPIVPQIQDQFVQSWRDGNRATGKLPASAVTAAPIPRGAGTPVPDGDTQLALSETAPSNLKAIGDQTQRTAVDAIQKSTKSIDLLMYNLDSPAEVQALIDAQRRGVKVRVVLDHEHRKGFFGKLAENLLNLNMNAVERLKAAGVDVRWFDLPKGADEMHAKVAVFDGNLALGGSTNWVTSSNLDNHELGLWVQGPAVGQLQGVFNGVWQKQTSVVPKLSTLQQVDAWLGGLVARFI